MEAFERIAAQIPVFRVTADHPDPGAAGTWTRRGRQGRSTRSLHQRVESSRTTFGAGRGQESLR